MMLTPESEVLPFSPPLSSLLVAPSHLLHPLRASLGCPGHSDELPFRPGDSESCSEGPATCTSDGLETQPGWVGEARCFNKLPAENRSLRTAVGSQPRRSPGSSGQHSCHSAGCLWRGPTSASCHTATGSVFLLQGSCQAPHQHQAKVSSDFLHPSLGFLTNSPFSFVLSKVPRDWPETISPFLCFDISSHSPSLPLAESRTHSRYLALGEGKTLGL